MTDHQHDVEARTRQGAGSPASRQRAWFPCHEFLNAVIKKTECGPLPAAGTPDWLVLADGDPRKLLALAEAGVHHVLRIDAEQEARAAASSDISSAVDCTALAQRMRNGRGPNYIPRRKETA